MKKIFNKQTLGVVAIICLALFIGACNRGTGCPNNFGIILPLF